VERGEATIIAEGRHLRLMQRGGWEYVDRRRVSGIVAIVALTESGRLLLVEQYRHAVNHRCIELPAGLAGDGPDHPDEPLVAAAQRELLEETGYEARDFELLTEGPPSAGLTTELISFYRARGLRKVAPGGGDESEAITVHEAPLAEIDGWLAGRAAAGLLIDPKVYTGLYFLTRSCVGPGR
jgi:ADP-ribose pyrophosphatase